MSSVLLSLSLSMFAVAQALTSLIHDCIEQGFLTCWEFPTCGDWRVARWGILCICFHPAQSCAVSPL